MSATARVTAGHAAAFVVWVWSTNAAGADVSVKAAVSSAPHLGLPKFTVCPATGAATCAIGALPIGLADELEVTVPVHASATRGEHVRVTATASAPGATAFAASATDVVQLSSASSPAAGTGTSPGNGTSPQVTLPVPGSLPAIAGTGVSPINPSGLFPRVGASPGKGTGSLGLPPARPHALVHAKTVASTVPLDSRLLGGQLAGLAVLAGAVTIAIARLSLRKPKAPHDHDASPPRM